MYALQQHDWDQQTVNHTAIRSNTR